MADLRRSHDELRHWTGREYLQLPAAGIGGAIPGRQQLDQDCRLTYVRFGVDLRYGRQFRADSGSNRTGNLSFTAGPTSNGGTTGGLGIATFLTGQVSSFVRTAAVTGDNAKEFQKRDFFYGQDTWRVTQRLTLNLGLRWDLIFPERVNGPNHG